MSDTLEQKVDFLFKKLGYSVAKTGASAGITTTNRLKKTPSQESISSPLVVPSGSVWTQSDLIPDTRPASTAGVVQNYNYNANNASMFRMTEDPTVPDEMTWIAYETYNDTTSTRLDNWIDPGNFGPSYGVRVFYDGATNEIFPDDENYPWTFDYSAGVLNFTGDSAPNIVSSVYLIGSRYIGEQGAGGAKITVSSSVPTGNDVREGSLWWNTTNGDLLIYYDDGQLLNNQGTTAQWVSATGGSGGLWTLDSGTNTITTAYTVSASAKAFKIDHPLPEKKETHDLVYISTEGPSADLLYHGTVELVDGKASINIDSNSNQTEGTFESLCKNVKCFTTNTTDWTSIRGYVTGNILNIESEHPGNAKVDWMVIGTRKDGVENKIPTSDENGDFYPEVLKG